MNRVRPFAAVALAVLSTSATCGAGASTPPAAPAAPTVECAEPSPEAVISWCGQEQNGVRTLVLDLRRRERELEERERTLALREGELNAAQARLDERLQSLEALRVQLDKQLGQVETDRERRVDSLVKMVEQNRAATIAPMVAELDVDLAVEVLDRMSRQKAGKLLGALPSGTAAKLAARMTRPVKLEAP